MRTTAFRIAACGLLAFATVWADEPKLEPIEVGQPVRVEVFPPAVKLFGPESRMQLIATGHYADGSVQDLTRASQFASTAANVAVAENSVLLPRGSGQAEVAIITGG